MLLDLHGAMVIEDVEDGEGDLLSGIRGVIGDDPPVISTLDLHGNITQRMCDAATALIPCDNYPHTDFLERGLEASEMIVGTLRGELSPVMAWRQLPMLWTGGQFTGREPFDSIVARAHALETQPGILTASVAPGFPVGGHSRRRGVGDRGRRPGRGPGAAGSRCAWRLDLRPAREVPARPRLLGRRAADGARREPLAGRVWRPAGQSRRRRAG